jgi:two-component system, NarL family, response regulator
MESYTDDGRSLRVLIVDDHAVVREGLAALINRCPDMLVVAEAATGREAVEQHLRHSPDVTLMDLRMPEMDGVDAIVAIRRECPTARIIVLTTFDDDEDIFRGLQAGAKGYLLKDVPSEELIECLRAVHRGKTVIPPAVAARLASRLMTTALTTRELEVLTLMAEGKGNKEIADALFVSEATAKTHVNAILRKMDAEGRTEAVTTALKRGVLRLK